MRIKTITHHRNQPIPQFLCDDRGLITGGRWIPTTPRWTSIRWSINLPDHLIESELKVF